MRCLVLALLFVPLLAQSVKESSSVLRIPLWPADAVEMAEAKEAPANLQRGDFRAKLDGAPARVVALRGPADDLILIVVLDLVEDLALIELAKQAVVAQARNLPDNAYVALMRAQEGLQVLIDPTPDREALAKAVNNLTPGGRAGLLDTVETAAHLSDSLLRKSGVRVALLYVTDSNIYNYREDFTNPVINSSDQRDLSRHFPEGLVREKISRVAAALSATQSPLFIVHLDYRGDRLNEAYQTGLMELSATTGGSSVFCRSQGEVSTALQNTFQAIAGHYSLSLALPDRPLKNVQIELEGHGNLTYRSRFLMKER